MAEGCTDRDQEYEGLAHRDQRKTGTEIYSNYPRVHLEGQTRLTREADRPEDHQQKRPGRRSSDCPNMEGGYQGWDKEELARRQAAERLARYELREQQQATVEPGRNMGGQPNSEESIAKGKTRDLIDMDLVGENSSQETLLGISRRTGSAKGEPGPSFKNWQEDDEIRKYDGSMPSPRTSRREFPRSGGRDIHQNWNPQLETAVAYDQFQEEERRSTSRPYTPRPRIQTPGDLVETLESLKKKLDQVKSEDRVTREVVLTSDPTRTSRHGQHSTRKQTVQFQGPEPDEEEEDRRQQEQFKAQQQARRQAEMDRRNQQTMEEVYRRQMEELRQATRFKETMQAWEQKNMEEIQMKEAMRL